MTDDKEFLALVDEYTAALWRIAGVYAGADGETDDLYQEIVLQLWRSFSSFRGDASPGTWLYRVALNTALTWQRSAESRSRRREAVEQRAKGNAETLSGTSGRPAPRSQKEILSDFLDLLSGPDRWVLLLYMEGLNYREIAEVTGLSESAVGVRIHRMKQAFTDRYLEP